MEPAVPSEAPLDQGIDVLTVSDDDHYDGVFKNLYDCPFVLVNRVGDEIHAEVLKSYIDGVTDDRIMTAQSVAGKLGFRIYARKFGDLYEDDNTVLLRFSDDPAKGLIWALEGDLMGGAWSLQP